jgi:hypothetical protein
VCVGMNAGRRTCGRCVWRHGENIRFNSGLRLFILFSSCWKMMIETSLAFYSLSRLGGAR